MTSDELSPEIGALLASLTEQAPSNDAAAVFAAALAARAAQPLQSPPIDTEVSAFARAIDDVHRTVEQLRTSDWKRRCVNGLNVGQLVGHLIGTQLSMAAELGLQATAATSTDHVESTRQAIADGAATTPIEAASQFARVSAVLIDHLSQLDSAGLAAPSRFGTIEGDIRFILMFRVFELWTHDNDLRAAVGLARVEPDADRLWMMTRTVMPLVGRMGGDRLRIVLTGPGGGVWPASGDEVATIAVDATAFCRRAANRMTIDDLQADITGDAAAARQTLGALAELALD
ncbi:MAG: maleylpyruvate isomerase family mycothiol-dependent enzyme [Ilumatobacteraceae bacterium]